MRDAFIRKLTEMAEQDPSVFLIVGDLGYGVVDEFSKKFPSQFLNAGISEQNMIGLAAGLSNTGFKVFVYSIANFPTMRCLEQIRNDITYHDLNVTIVSIGAGFGYGTLGYSHYAIEDLAVLRAFDGLRIHSPGDACELDNSLDFIMNNLGPNYLRVGKNGEKLLEGPLPENPNVPRRLQDDGKYLILSTGNIGVDVTVSLKNLTDSQRALFSHYSINGLSHGTLAEIDFSRFLEVVTVEEHVLTGGFGSLVLEYLSDNRFLNKVRRIGIRSQFGLPIGDQSYLKEFCGIDHNGITRTLVKIAEQEYGVLN